MAAAGTWNVLAGRYRLCERIAAGGTGEVWRADDEMLGRPVAVKLLRPEYAGDAAALARFEGEARHAGRLFHPGIVGVYDYGRDPQADVPFLVMELVDGPSLAAVLAAGRQPPVWVLDVIGQVGAGLAAAHAAGLVHRDIKPGNLVLAPDGRVKITDFGIASVVGAASQTQAGMLVGTPGYLAPERATGSPATPASDMYALGIVAWEALTGGPPFTGGPLDVAMSHAHSALPPLPPQVPTGLARLVGALTARNPEDRPSGTAAATEAARLRTELAAEAALRLPAPPLGPPSAPADTLMLTGIGASTAPARGKRLFRIVDWPWSAVVLAGLGLAAVMALAVLLSTADGGAAQQPGAVPSVSGSVSASTSPAGSVTVDNAALDGQPANAVLTELRRSGLRPRLSWMTSGHYQPGTVITIEPAGTLSPGAIVTVTAAMSPPRHHHHDDNGG